MPVGYVRPIVRALTGAGALMLVLAASSWALLGTTAGSVISGAFDGESIGFINKYVAIHKSLDPDVRTLGYFIENGTSVLMRLSLVLSAAGVALLLLRRSLAIRIAQFFDASERPEILALFRIAVAAGFLVWISVTPVSPFLSVPEIFIVPPPGMGWAVSLLPLDPDLLVALQIILFVSSVLLLVGLRTPIAATVTTVAGVILLGFPQFFGKVDHYHHLIWFAALLSVSRAGDAWSVDAILRNKKVRRGTPGPSREYALPLRVAMVLIGCMYLFPGIWKIIIGGWAWPAETIRFQLYAKWMSLDWLPSLRIDQSLMFLTAAGLGVIAFECFFLLALLHERWRQRIAFGGILFHISVWLMMGINFWSLIICYVVFLDSRILGRFGLLNQMQEGAFPGTIRHESDGDPGPRLRLVRYLGGALLGLSFLSGATLTDSWPIAVYPTFAGVPEPNAFVLSLQIEEQEGNRREIRPLREAGFRDLFGASRAEGLVHQIVWEPDTSKRNDKARSLVSLIRPLIPDLARGGRVTIMRDLVRVDPAYWGSPPVRREILTEIELSGRKGVVGE